MKKRDINKWIWISILVLLFLGLGIILVLQNHNEEIKFNFPPNNDLPQLPERGNLNPSSFNSQFSNQTISSSPHITGKSIHSPSGLEGRWVVYNSQFYGYNDVWLWNSQGKLSSQNCWSKVGNDWRFIDDWCNFNLSETYIYINGTVYYQNFSEYLKDNWSWTNNSWFYSFGGLWLQDNQNNWYYITNSWVYLENNWKTKVNEGLEGVWNQYKDSWETFESGSYWFADPSWIMAKNFWITNQSGSYYVSNDTWINLGSTYALYNQSAIYHWDTWYFTAENNWTWVSDSWQNWNNLPIWKSQDEQYYFNNSLIWIQNSWKVNV
jgi:hypothetical protein